MQKFKAAVFAIRFSPGQRRVIQARAGELGMTFSSFVRHAALRASGQQQPVPFEEREQLESVIQVASGH